MPRPGPAAQVNRREPGRGTKGHQGRARRRRGRAVRWKVPKELRPNLAAADAGMSRYTSFVVGLAVLCELLQVGVVGETAKIGPIEVRQTAEVQLLLQVLIAYFLYAAVAFRVIAGAAAVLGAPLFLVLDASRGGAGATRGELMS